LMDENNLFRTLCTSKYVAPNGVIDAAFGFAISMKCFVHPSMLIFEFSEEAGGCLLKQRDFKRTVIVGGNERSSRRQII